MFDDLKLKLLDDPTHIVNILEKYSFCKIRPNDKEIRCAIDDEGNPSSIVIRLRDNDSLYVTDYGRNMSNDLMGYISQVRNIPLRDVLAAIKEELHLDSFYSCNQKTCAFGGLFENIGNCPAIKEVPTIPESLLSEYGNTPNLRFYRDGISLDTQRKFGIGYSIAEQRITIPIRNEYGELIGIKGRCNYTPDEYEPKYLYIEPCPMSLTLYGYNENYSSMINSDVYVFEAEKSVMQADSMGYHNTVAIGSNSLSQQQARLIVSLNPKNVVFMLDNSLPLENTFRNIHTLKSWQLVNNFNIKYFNWEKCRVLDEKDSPTDKGKRIFDQILAENLEDFMENA